MDVDSNPYRPPQELPSADPPSAVDARAKLELAVDRYSNAILVRRWMATAIDMGCFFFLFMSVHAVLGDDLHQKLLPLTLLSFALYYPLMEGLLGATIGKFAVGIKVVDYEGQRPGMWKKFLRSVLRIVEVNPFLLGGIPAGIAAVVSRRKQRLGDMLAKTLVVYRGDI